MLPMSYDNVAFVKLFADPPAAVAICGWFSASDMPNPSWGPRNMRYASLNLNPVVLLSLLLQLLYRII